MSTTKADNSKADAANNVANRPARHRTNLHDALVASKTLALHLVLACLAFVLFLPFLWMLLTSVKHLQDVGERSWIPQLSAGVDRGQITTDAIESIRDQIRTGDSPAANYLANYVNLEDETLHQDKLVAQLNMAIFADDPLPDDVIQSVELSPRSQVYDADVRADRANPIYPPPVPPTEAERQSPQYIQALKEYNDEKEKRDNRIALFNASVLNDALPQFMPGPVRFRWHNYLQVFEQIPFVRFYWNSLFIASFVTFLQVFTSSLAAFSFSRLQWHGRDQVFVLYLATMMLPGLVMMIPNYQIMISLGLVDTMTGLILPGAFTAFGTFLLRQFMLGIPASLDEAAEIDGASKWRLYWDVILPLSRPGLVTLAIFTFMGTYNSFFWPLVMLKSEHKYTLPIGLLSFQSSAGDQTNLMMAAVTMSVVPMIIVFVVLQKQLVKGIQLGAVKG